MAEYETLWCARTTASPGCRSTGPRCATRSTSRCRTSCASCGRLPLRRRRPLRRAHRRGRVVLHRHRPGRGHLRGRTPTSMAAGNYPGYPTPWMYDDPGRDVGPKSRDLWKPVIAAVQGMACGGAFYMLGEVEFIIASRRRHLLRPPRHLRDDRRVRADADALEDAVPRDHAHVAARRPRAHVRRAGPRDRPGHRGRAPGRAARARRRGWRRSSPTRRRWSIQGTMRALWTALEVPRTQAIGLANLFTRIGSDAAAFKAGQDRFASGAAGRSGGCAERPKALDVSRPFVRSRAVEWCLRRGARRHRRGGAGPGAWWSAATSAGPTARCGA